MKNKIKINDKSGNLITAFLRSLNLGLANFWRNKFLSIATILVMAVIIFIFNIILSIQVISNQALQALSQRVDIILYLQDNIDFYNAKQLADSIKQISGVKEVKFTSKEEALQIIAKTHPETAEFIQKFGLKNPLPPSISIITNNPEDHVRIQNYIQNSEYKNLIQNYESDDTNGQKQSIDTVSKNLNSISRFIRQLVFWIILVFLIGGTLVVVNAVQLTIYTRKNEIHIMRLVGATKAFIYTPFIFEGILYGIFAVLLSLIFLLVVGSTLQIDSNNLWNYYSNLNLLRIFLTETLITILLSGICSYIAVEQHIKGKLNLN